MNNENKERKGMSYYLGNKKNLKQEQDKVRVFDIKEEKYLKT